MRNTKKEKKKENKKHPYKKGGRKCHSNECVKNAKRDSNH